MGKKASIVSLPSPNLEPRTCKYTTVASKEPKFNVSHKVVASSLESKLHLISEFIILEKKTMKMIKKKLPTTAVTIQSGIIAVAQLTEVI